MKRIMLFALLIIVFLIPTNAVFAQDFDSDIPADCQLEVVLERFTTLLMESSDEESLMYALEYLMERVETCAEPWLTSLFVELEPLLNQLMGGMDAPIQDFAEGLMLAPDDGVLTSDEAEYAINQIFSGNVAEGNQYLCEDEQVSEDDVPFMTTINELSCMEENGAMNCYIDAIVAGEVFQTTVIFEIENGKLCENETIE